MATEYDVLGDTIKRQASRLKDAASRKLNQQFTGRLSSGAAAKVASKALTDIDVGTQDQLAKLDYEKAAKEREERLIKEGQSFQTQERLGSQDFGSQESEKVRSFTSGEAQKGRTFQTGEREAAQTFAGGEAQKGREFATSERIGQQAFAGDETQRNRVFAREERLGTQTFQENQSGLDRILQQANINLGYDQLRTQQQQFSSEFEENVRTGLFNKIVALKDIDPSRFDQILQALGRGGARSQQTKDYLGGLTGIPVVSTNIPFPASTSGINPINFTALPRG